MIQNKSDNYYLVAPFVGVWIEMCEYQNRCFDTFVAPFVGVWIEINSSISRHATTSASLPSWECGLKSDTLASPDTSAFVAPFVGVWIEIILRYNPTNSPLVDPFVRMQIQLYFTWCGLY